MYPLFETIKITNGIPQNTALHQLRMQQSYQQLFGKECPFLLNQLLNTVPKEYKKGIVKARFSYNADSFLLEFSPYYPRTIKTLKLLTCNDIDYSLKYSDRSLFEKLLLQKGSCDDILIVKNGLITDTSFSNIIFYNGERWLTPSSPLLKGTQRQYLLQTGIIYEQEITEADLPRFQSFKLINAMLDFDTSIENTIEVII